VGRPSLICFCLPARGRGRGMTKLIGSGRGEGTGSIRIEVTVAGEVDARGRRGEGSRSTLMQRRPDSASAVGWSPTARQGGDAADGEHVHLRRRSSSRCERAGRMVAGVGTGRIDGGRPGFREGARARDLIGRRIGWRRGAGAARPEAPETWWSATRGVG
jgi:hypothetical protein